MAKIMFFVSSMQGGGAERVASLLSNHWDAQGHNVTLVPTYFGHGECRYPLSEGVRLVYLADRLSAQRKTPWNQLRRLLALRKLIRETQPHAVVSFLPHVNVAILIATIGINLRVVVSERSYPPARHVGFIINFFRRLMYPRAHSVVMQTQQGLAWLQTSCAKAAGSVIANPMVYPLPSTEPKISLADTVDVRQMVLLAAGRLVAAKGFDTLLDAFASLATQFPEWDLVILGEGIERDNLEKQRDRLGLTNRVRLPGRAGNMSDWYNRAQIYVLSSRYEGFPNTLIEAMSHGVPVVSFACKTGPQEIIRHEDNGVLVSPISQARGLGRALVTLMSDSAARKRYALTAIEVRERFSIEKISADWEAVLSLGESIVP